LLHTESFNGITTAGSVATYSFQFSPESGMPLGLVLTPGSQGTVPPVQVSVTASGLVYSRVTQTFNGTVTLVNIGSTALNGRLELVLTALSAGVVLANATGIWNNFPFVTIPNAPTLSPGAAATIPVRFKNTSSNAVTFTPVVYSGSLP